MKLRSSLRLIPIIALTSLSCLARGTGELDHRACNNGSLRGGFGFTAHGTTLAALGLPPAVTGAFVSSGSANFDGHGYFSLNATSSFNGVIQGPSTVTGTYSVNSDCSYTSYANNGVTFRGVIVDHGRELLILQTTPGAVITGIAKKRSVQYDEDSRKGSESCSAASFAGIYGFLADGFAGAPTLPNTAFGPLAGVGVINVKRDGTFTMMAQRSFEGVLDAAPLPLTGSYTVSSECTAELTFDVGFHFSAAIVNDSEAVFVETDPGTALIVVSKRL